MKRYDVSAAWNKWEKDKNTKNKNITNESQSQFNVKKAYDIYQLDKTIDLPNLQSDLLSLNKTIDTISGGWQTQETMNNTKSSIQSMYNRLGKYQEYGKKYGTADISDLLNSYKTVLDGWDGLTETYGKYKDAKTFAAETKALGNLNGMSSKEVQTEINKYKKTEDIYNTAKKYQAEINTVKNQKNSAEARSRGLNLGNVYADKITAAETKLNDYLKSVGYKSIADIEKAVRGGKIAYTTTDGQNIMWQSLYDTKKYNEDLDSLYNEISSRDDFEEFKSKGEKDLSPIYNMDEEYSMASKKEKNIHKYYYGRERAGLEEIGTADRYLASIEKRLRERSDEKYLTELAGFTDEHPVLGTAYSVGLNLASGVEFLTDPLKDPVGYFKEGERETNFSAKASSTIRNTVSQKVDWNIGNWDAFDFLYNTGMSAVDSAVSMATFGAGGGVALGLSAAAQGTNDALERGLDNRGAFLNGLASGVFEGLFESVSIGKFKSLKEAPVDGVKTIIKNIGKSMLTNASEETLTELANITYDYFANADLSQIKTDIRAYENAGMAPEEARRKVALEQSARVIEAGASGALMGIGFGGVSQISAYSNSKAQGQAIKENFRESEVFDIASDPEVGQAYKLYTEYAKKGVNAENATDAQLGALYSTAKQEAYETFHSKKSTVEQKLGAAKTLAKISAAETVNPIKAQAKRLNLGEETKVTETGEAVDVKALKVNGDKVVLNTKKGEVSVDDMTLTEKDAELVVLAKGIAKTDGESIGNLFLSMYDEKSNVEEYANSFNLTMSYAKNDFTYDHILNKKGSLTTDQVKEIYQETRIAADRAKKEALEKLSKEMADKKLYKGIIDDSVIDYENTSAKGKVNWKDLTVRQREAVTFVKGFAQATGMNLNLITDGLKKGINGAFDISNNTITLDIHAGLNQVNKLKDTIIPTMSHETTHWMKGKAPELWRSLNEVVFTTLTDYYNSLTAENSVKDKITLLDNLEPWIKHTEQDAREKTVTEEDIILAERNKYGASEDISREEIIARACEDMLSMSKEGRKIFNSLSETERKTFVEKIKGVINDLINWVNELLNSYKSESTEARIMREYKEELLKASEIWDKMLKESVQANQSLEKSGAYKGEGKAETVYSLRETAEADVEKALNDISYREDVYLTENSPSIIASQKGVKNLPMLMKASHIRENIFTEQEAKNKGLKVGKEINYHGLGKELFLKIIGGLDDVTLAYRGTKNADNPQRRENYFLLISQYKDADGNTVNVPIYINEKGQYNRVLIETNKIATVYGKNNFNEYINRELQKRNLVRIKNRSTQASERTAPIAGGYSMYASNDNIPQEKNIVNTNISKSVQNDTNVRNSLRDTDVTAITQKDADVRKTNSNKYITFGMTDVERAEVLKDTNLKIVKYVGNNDLNSEKVLALKNSYNSYAGNILKALGEKFGVFKTYSNENVSLDFQYSRGSLGESVHKQGDISTDFYDFAKMLYVFDDVVKNAVPIEVHTDKYARTKRADDNLKYDYVLLSAFRDNGYIIPVEFHLKEFNTAHKNKLYVSITLGKIKIEDKVRVQTPDNYNSNQTKYTRSSSIINVADLLKNVNSKYGNFFKYIPSELLNEEQLNSKRIAVKDENYRLSVMRGEDVADMLKEEAKSKGYGNNIDYRMDHTAPNSFDGYSNSMDMIDKSYGGDSSIYSQNAVYYYGEGRTYDKKAIDIIRSARNNPDMAIKIYRAVPSGNKEMRVRNGDWVAITKEYAAEHGERILDGDYRIIENEVPAKHLFSNGDSINEWGYDNGNIHEVYKNTSNNVKVLDVTYSDNNEIIPLSKRYDESNSDSRYSRREASVYDIMGETDRLIKENEKLKEDVERLKERLKLEKTITNGKILNENHILAAARHLRKISNSNVDNVEIAKQLEDIYSFIASDEVTWDQLYPKLYNLADIMAKDVKPEVVVDEFYKELLSDIKKTKISLDVYQKQEARHRLDNNWNRRFFGKVVISDNGTPIETMWTEWREKYGSIFSEDVVPNDMIVELYDILNMAKEASEIVEEYDEAEFKRWLAEEIYNQYWNVSAVKTTADKHSEEIKKLKYEHRKVMSELRNDYKARTEEKVKEQRLKDKAHYGDLIEKLKIKKDKEVYMAKLHGEERLAKYKEGAEKKTKIQSITSNSLSLNEMLVKNSKDKHIPEIMKEPVAALLKAIDFSSKRLLSGGTPTQKDVSLTKALNKVKDMMLKASNGQEELVELYGHGLDEEIEKVVDNVTDIRNKIGDNEFVLNNMSLTDLQSLDKMVKTIKHAVNKLNKFHTVHHAQGIANLAQESMGYLDSLGKGKVYDGLKGKAKKLIDWGNALPYYAFKRFGAGGIKVYEAFQDGWDKFAFNTKKIIDYAKEVYTDKEAKEWSKEIKTFKFLVPANETVKSRENYVPKYQELKLTIPQMMSIYCLNKREQARKHLMQGGIRAADFKTEKGEIVSDPKGAILTEGDIETIINSLTQRQKEVADKLQAFMNDVCADWGNEVSMARFGYKAFGEENYFPIQSDNNNLAVNDETEQSNSLFKLLNMSFTKSIDEKANNRIVISDIFDVFAKHTSDMSKYNSLALPVLDSFKWYNYTEKEYVAEDGQFFAEGVKQSIENAFGKDGQNYFTTFLKDINGTQEVDREQFGKSFLRKFKIASVAANLRVILLQPTSYVRASAVIDNKYLLKALYHKPKIKKAETYCGIALWKSMGYFDTNIQKGVAEQIKHDESFKDKAVSFTMKGAEYADKVTWGALWNACELEIRDTRKDLKVGSEEFNNAIAKRLREVIYATQVVDSTMTRSQLMRSNKGWDMTFTNFASEPTLAYNMVQDAYMQYSLDARRMGKKAAIKKNGKRIGKVVFAYTMTNALAALVESGFDVYRDDDDEEIDIVKFMELYLSNFGSNMSITAKIPYIKELHSVFKGYGLSRSELEWMETSYKAYTGFQKYLQGKGNTDTTFKNGLKTLSYLSGLPFFSAYRDLMAALTKIDLFTEEDLKEMFEDIPLYGIKGE